MIAGGAWTWCVSSWQGSCRAQAHNAPLHLFSASPELIGFGQTAYRWHSAETSLLLGQLFERLREEGFAMSFTMEDFKRQYVKEHFGQLTPEEREEVLQALPPEERLAGLPPEQRLAGLSAEQIEQNPAAPRAADRWAPPRASPGVRTDEGVGLLGVIAKQASFRASPGVRTDEGVGQEAGDFGRTIRCRCNDECQAPSP